MALAKGDTTSMSDVSVRTPGAGGQDLRVIRWLAGLNLLMAGLQPISAGLLMSGFGPALRAHAAGGLTLQLLLLVQAGAAALLWRQGRAPVRVTGVSLALFVVVLLQNALGHGAQYWLHVPLGVGLVGALHRLRRSLDVLPTIITASGHQS